MPAVALHEVTRSFPGAVRPALNRVSVTVESGCITGLVGPDGAGKTTLMRLMAGLLRADSGRLDVLGRDPVRDSAALRGLIGYMPQKFGLYEDLTVMENLTLHADLRGLVGAERRTTFERLLAFTDLARFTDRLAGKLSGGMKQKLGLACALLGKPRLLLLDEPGVGVDPVSRRELWRMVRELSDDGMTIVWSTAYLDEAERCDAVLVLHEGQTLFAGTPAEFVAGGGRHPDGRAPSFEDVFVERLGGAPAGESPLTGILRDIPRDGTTAIAAHHLTRKFGDFTAADRITFEVERGEIYGLLGPNGAGKSTTFRMLCGLLAPTSGEAMAAGIDLRRSAARARQRIGYMAQKFSLYGNLTVSQNLAFFSGAYGLHGRAQREAMDAVTACFHLGPHLGRKTDLLPLGFKQRLALACAVMHGPDLLFLDEPTSGVDPVTRREFWSHIRAAVARGVTVMVTTHFMDEAEYCDRIGLVYRGRLIASGTPAELKRKAGANTMEDAFIALVEENDGATPDAGGEGGAVS
ncbi:ATP-binding cassette domain-containing protein [Geminisphaera colitermitum]|uniref:ATP-binding cassette domain-containing protein n=1 Tax=Geminisphaera colitermitum TaxID=1148786 RepID=UPI000158C8C4|nr:ATP-binding cassette domain-containing protein [Geminisphaera colitermitum]